MNRRQAIRAFTTGESPKSVKISPIAVNNGIEPFSGNFDYQTARHLLTRCNFGATNEQILQAIEDGLETTLDQILTQIAPTTEPLNPSFEDDPNVPIGASWVDQPFAGGVPAILYRISSLQSWTYEQMAAKNISIQEKMTLFWHNHFAIHDIRDARFGYKYISSLRNNCLGNFKELVKTICVDPMMLVFLNGHENSVTAPNENFARELLELFTIGKGDLIGPGDYTHYTESDISEMARVMTGWRHQGRYATDDTLPHAIFVANRHDNGEKQLSDKFGNKIILPGGEEEYRNLVDVIFQQEEVSKFICRKFYQWFVNFEINDAIEANIIEPMAQLLRAENYEIEPVMRVLLASEHFLNETMHGCQIKNPLDYIFGIHTTSEVELVSDLTGQYQQFAFMSGYSNLLQMRYFDPPSVAGWKAYYQSPIFYQHWLNSVTLPLRIRYSSGINNAGLSYFTPILVVDPLILVNKLEVPSEVNGMLDQLSRLFYPKPLLLGQLEFLKEQLLGDLEDFEWETEYLEYAIDPTNEGLADPVRKRLKNLFTAMMGLAEFQLM